VVMACTGCNKWSWRALTVPLVCTLLQGGIFGSLAADFSPAAAAACMTRLSKMSARVMGDIGFR
jgi:hypothetical protein